MAVLRRFVRSLRLCLLGFGLYLISYTGEAQLVANFTPDKTSGCPPLAITFINTSSGASPSATYTWDFGNGNIITTGNAHLPVGATYLTAQVYTVTLTIHDGGQVAIKSEVITVYLGPQVAFSAADTIGCVPLTTTFSSSSTPGTGTITNYFWDFGDGNTLFTSSATVSNIYQFAGTYSVSLTVTNSNGCSQTLKKINQVTVLPALTVGFSADSTNLCSLADAVQFINTSTGSPPLIYSWNFGDGGNSSSQNPSHQYAMKGLYSVQLTVSNSAGCLAKLTKPAYINAADYTPDFGTSPALCSGTGIQFTDLSSPSPTGSSLWSFGDGGSGIGSNISHTYAGPGNFIVTLTDNFGGCSASVSKTIAIASGPPTGGFLVNKGAFCQSPMLVNFTDTTTGAVKWLWNFTGNPGDTSTAQDPSFLYSTNGLYTPTLTVSNASGCSTTVSETLNSAQPTATISMDTTLTPSATICADVTAQFTAISQDTIAQFNWSFGDGSTSNAPNPSHTYTVPGTYIITLNFITNHGCAGTAFPPDTVRVYPKPHALFTAMDSLPCASNQAELFTNLDDSSQQFLWFYGDGSSDINNNINHIHFYNAAGMYNMTLVASSPGCKSDTSTISRFVQATPMPNLQVANTCDSNRLTATLSNTTAGGSEYIWSFGDGSPNDTDWSYIPQRTHAYPGPGVYTASITAVFGACTQNSGPVPVYILPAQHPTLSTPAVSICENGNLPVQISGLDTNYQALAQGSATYYDIVQWQYGDGTNLSPQINGGVSTTYSGTLTNLKPGEDSIRVILKSRYFNCQDTSNYIPINIEGPVAAFGAQEPVCYSSPVIFTDSSKGTQGVPIVQWQWSFGDGNGTTRTNNDTVMHQYAFPGTYTPALTVTDSNGCTATAALAVGVVTVYGSKADFFWNPTAIAPGDTVTFYNSSTTNAGATFQWYFYSNGATSTNPDSVQHVFSNIGQDTVRLVASATTPGTCADTSIQIVVVKNLTASFTYTTQYIDHANCPPMVAYFTSITKNAISLHWDFGDGATADNNPDPSHTYNLPGVYVITLTAYGVNGISVTVQDSLTVKGPYAMLYSSLQQACIPAIDTLHATSSFADSYTWDFGDGTVFTTQDTFAVHQYILPGLFTPALILTDSTGCEVTFQYKRQLIMDTLHVLLGPPVILCDSGSVAFIPQVLSMVADTLGLPLTYHWNFGTGQPADTANTANAGFDYHNPGKYFASLQILSPIGCWVQAIDTVLAIAPIRLKYVSDTGICRGNSIDFRLTGADTYTWFPDSSLSDIQGGSAIARPDSTTTYRVVGKDKYGCFADTATMTVSVASLPTVTVDPEISIPGGMQATLASLASADVISWNWTPPYFLSCLDCASPTTSPQAPISYTVTVTNANGCTASATVAVRLTCTENTIHIPNAFTPNHDGNNDLFYPVGTGVKIIRYFQVFSRWGQLLYSQKDIPANDKSFGWDGTFNGVPQPAGTYVYMAGIECFTGETYSLKGTVELLR